jgi:hypothetical protein
MQEYTKVLERFKPSKCNTLGPLFMYYSCDYESCVLWILDPTS